MFGFIKKIFGTSHERPIRRMQPKVVAIGERIDEAAACTREAESDARWLSRAAEIAVALNIVRTFLDALRGDGESARRRLAELFDHEAEHPRLLADDAHADDHVADPADRLSVGAQNDQSSESSHVDPVDRHHDSTG